MTPEYAWWFPVEKQRIQRLSFWKIKLICGGFEIMTDQQFSILIQELHGIKKEIIDKCDEIRCGGIDIEEEIKKRGEKLYGRIRP
jgi:hypothetical protein